MSLSVTISKLSSIRGTSFASDMHVSTFMRFGPLDYIYFSHCFHCHAPNTDELIGN